MLVVTLTMFASATACVILQLFDTLRGFSRVVDPTIGSIYTDNTTDVATSLNAALVRLIVSVLL